MRCVRRYNAVNCGAGQLFVAHSASTVEEQHEEQQQARNVTKVDHGNLSDVLRASFTSRNRQHLVTRAWSTYNTSISLLYWRRYPSWILALSLLHRRQRQSLEPLATTEMALRRAAVPATSTRLLSRYAANSNAVAAVWRRHGGAGGSTLIPASSALLHSSSDKYAYEKVSPPVATAVATGNSRGFASAVPAESVAPAANERGGDSNNLRYFHPVEKFANGVAVIR